MSDNISGLNKKARANGAAPDFNRCAAFVDLGAIKRNAKRLIGMLSPGCGLCAVVKADGYGHGAAEVSKAALEAGCRALGVATAQEGAALRESGIDAPIIVLGILYGSDIDLAIGHNLALTAADYDGAAKIAERARHMGRVAGIHFKADTGMARLGLPVVPYNACTRVVKAHDACTRVVRLEGVRVDGVFSHLADSDEQGGLYTGLQASSFDIFLERLREAGIEKPWHIANSGAVLQGRDTDGSMVRVGIALYGLSESRKLGFEPALSLKARIVFVKPIGIGSTVGYGRMFTAERETVVATVSIGYGDGYPRLLSNKGCAIVRGRRVPVIGSVCMDQLMLDVTDIGGVYVGDEATLIGGGDGLYIGADEMAEAIGTIPYEIVTGISSRVPRIYIYQ